MNWRKWLRILHRDFGYFIVGITLIYAISGILLNHRNDFNPDFRIVTQNVKIDLPPGPPFSEQALKPLIENIGDFVVFKRAYMTKHGNLKVFIHNGEILIHPETGEGELEYLQKRKVFFEMNMLHRVATHRSWKWVSDALMVILIFVTISGIFILKGRNGFMRRGVWFIVAGVVIPLVYMIFLI
ncbi:MAG: PepSY-associated TM helix domain-containing protein [Bacteroidota bacterium]